MLKMPLLQCLQCIAPLLQCQVTLTQHAERCSTLDDAAAADAAAAAAAATAAIAAAGWCVVWCGRLLLQVCPACVLQPHPQTAACCLLLPAHPAWP
jgi:hypothetical protein